MTTDPAVLRRAPPLSVRFPFTWSPLMPLVRDPALIVRFVVLSWVSSVRVPETDTEAKAWPAPRLTVFAPPVKLTADEVAVKPVADAVFQLPATVIVAEAKASEAAPEAVRSALNVGVEDVNVSVPANVMLPLNVVDTPLFTVRLFTVWVTLTVPPEAFTTRVERPGVKLPALVSTDRTVIVDPFARRTPPVATARVAAASERFDADVDRVVVPVPPWIARVFATRRLFAARVNVTVFEPLLKVRL